MKVLRLIAVTGSAMLALFLSENGLSALATAQQSENNGLSFADWCREKASLNPETKHTVEVLLQKAGTSDCNAANQKLSSLTKLDLNKNQISDLKPLQGLTNLTQLVLANNKISDIKPLQRLTKLEFLNLAENQISDLKPLQGLINLTSLNLENNQINDIKPLQGLTKLEGLYLSENAIAPKICPLKPESICKW